MKINIDKIFYLLKKENATKSIFVNYMDTLNNPFLILIACILSLRTKDEMTYKCAKRLFELGKTLQKLLKFSEEEIAKAIYPVGFYKTKAKNILGISKDIIEKYNSKVPDSIEELLKLKGVGRKTANLTVSKGFEKPAICVDTHVHRIFNRIGYVKTKTPDETEFELRDKLSAKYWKDTNVLFVTHGQNTCYPINPQCQRCVINQYCEKNI
ncbi:MAG: endonuclease III [Candidatus Gastranaerophilales bacterium]|nr:endonuclease III [Candidatus Gastranaerophilales bacterium]